MKIINITPSQAIKTYKNNSNERNSKKCNIKDTLEISSDALEMLSKDEGARAKKLQSISARIADGTYSVDLESVADKMLDNLDL